MHRRLLIAAVTATAVAVPAGGAVAAPAPVKGKAKKSRNIVQVASSTGQHKTLVKLVKAAGLAGTLSKAKANVTVFAPTDAAFAKVPKATLDALAADKAKLKSVLLYHVVSGRVPASKVVGLSSATTLNGASISIKVEGGSVFLNDTAKVTKTDVKASNGLIHVIDEVLLPPMD